MWLVSQVSTDNCRVVQVTSGERFPISNPGRLRVSVGIPKPVRLGTVAGFRAVIVQDNSQPELPGVSDDLVHNLKRIQALQIGVYRTAIVKADVGRDDRFFNDLVREG